MTTTTSSNTTTKTTMLTALAHQIEYYFSHCNLRKDVYLQTLRHLNDGCVPLLILCQFQKVKLLTLGLDAKQAVIQAIQARSKHLRVYQIDAKTGRKVNHDAEAESIAASSSRSADNHSESESAPTTTKDERQNTIFAIGTRDGEPLPDDELVFQPMSTLAADSSSSPSSPTLAGANTLILRDVDPSVTAKDILSLLESVEDCPSIVSIQPDVANCWYIVLDTFCREELMTVMMKLRQCTLAGQCVQARLKASAPTVLDPAALPMLASMPMLQMEMMPMMPLTTQQQRRRKRNKKKHQQKKRNNNQNSSSSSKASHVKTNSKPFVAKPPSLGEENFPTMPHENKVEWEVMPPVQQTLETGYSEESMSSSGSASSKCKGSDAASTATTVSSSVDLSCRKSLHGYAAALLKPRPVSSSNGSSSSNASKSVGETKGIAQGKQLPSEAMLAASTNKPCSILPAKKPFIKMPKLSMPLQPILIEPPIWGQGRSFADVMRSC